MSAVHDMFLDRAVEFIEAELTNKLLLTDIAKNADCDTSLLQQLFFLQLRLPISRYILHRRLALVRRRLQKASPNETVVSIAADCGFDHLSTFARQYFAAFHEKPSQTLAGISDPWSQGKLTQ